jgi:hypothetical protein
MIADGLVRISILNKKVFKALKNSFDHLTSASSIAIATLLKLI